MLEATASGLAGLLINQTIDLLWQHPGAFLIGLSKAFLPHAGNSSLPGDQLILLWAV